MSFSGRRTKWAILGAWAVLLAIFGPLGLKLPELTNDEIVLPSSSETAQANRLIAARFPGGDQKQVLLVYRRAGGLTDADRSAIAADARRAAEVPLVARRRCSRSRRPELVSAARRRRGHGPPALLGGDLPRPADDRGAARRSRRRAAASSGTSPARPRSLSDFNSAIKEADTTLLLATGLLVLLLLLAVYRSPILALLPLVVVVVAYSVASGVIYLLAEAGLPGRQHVDVAPARADVRRRHRLLPAARRALPREPPRRRQTSTTRSARALPQAAPAMIASAVTVIAAMLAMLAGVLGLNRTLGPVNAIGIAIVLLASLTLLPAVLAVTGERAFWPGKPDAAEKAGGVWQRLGERVRRRPLPWLAAVVLGLGACAAGISVYELHSGLAPGSSRTRRTAPAGTTR